MEDQEQEQQPEEDHPDDQLGRCVNMERMVSGSVGTEHLNGRSGIWEGVRKHASEGSYTWTGGKKSELWLGLWHIWHRFGPYTIPITCSKCKVYFTGR